MKSVKRKILYMLNYVKYLRVLKYFFNFASNFN